MLEDIQFCIYTGWFRRNLRDFWKW